MMTQKTEAARLAHDPFLNDQDKDTQICDNLQLPCIKCENFPQCGAPGCWRCAAFGSWYRLTYKIAAL